MGNVRRPLIHKLAITSHKELSTDIDNLFVIGCLLMNDGQINYEHSIIGSRFVDVWLVMVIPLDFEISDQQWMMVRTSKRSGQ